MNLSRVTGLFVLCLSLGATLVVATDDLGTRDEAVQWVETARWSSAFECPLDWQSSTAVVGNREFDVCLAPVTPTKISGVFQEGDIGVRFESQSTEIGLTFKLQALDRRPLYELTQDEETITAIVLGRLSSRFELALRDMVLDLLVRGQDPGHLGIAMEGDVSAVREFWSAPEVSLLPHLSRLLGERLQLVGTTHPATLPLHLLAASVPEADALHWSGQAPSLSEPEAGVCSPPLEPNCLGMCGFGCSCWSFVCGDCCLHPGCLLHDWYCRESLAHPYCVNFWIPFSVGGGC